MSLSYIQQLQNQINSKPSKLQEYQMKLKEREIFGGNIFDRFNNIGGGEQLRNQNGEEFLKMKIIIMKMKIIIIIITIKLQVLLIIIMI